MKRFCLLLALVCILCGCNAEEETEFVKTIATYPPASSSGFELPEGYTFDGDTTLSIIRTEDNTVVGGILVTGLDPDSLEEKNSEAYHRYLNSLGYMCEYLSMNADGYKAVSHYITDENSEKRRETSRCIFPKDGVCYDLWLDSSVATDDEKNLIRKAILAN